MNNTSSSDKRGLRLLSSPPQLASLEFAHSRAVVVGINDYRHVPRLRTAAPDAEELARILGDEYDYEVHLLTQEVTLARLRALLASLSETVGSDDRLVVYFAGHGIALEGSDGPTGYLVPEDGRPEDRSTFLRMDEFHDALLALPCRHALIILDCCFAGAMRWASTRALPNLPEVIHKERYERFIRDPAWQVLTSAAHDQTALDVLSQRDAPDAGTHSPFALALFAALRGQGDLVPAGGGDGVITAAELYLYLRNAVEVQAEAQAGHLQTPGLWPLKKHSKGEYIFLVPGHDLNLPPAPELTYANNPYRGLQAFEEEHAALFFGRTTLVKTLAETVAGQPLTIVLGASGTGKSSVVKAGLLPYLGGTIKAEQEGNGIPNAQGWLILPPMRPTESPLRELASLLQHHLPTFCQGDGFQDAPGMLANVVGAWARAHPGKRLLLMVDQFEELITLCRDEQEREHFCAALETALRTYPEQLRLILTLRSDFEPQFAGSALQTRWRAARFIIPPMTQAELREAIEGPAGVCVLYFEPLALVDCLIDEVIQTPGALPLLSFTLSELYIRYLERRGNDRALSQGDYELLGGVVGSLRNRATAEYTRLDAAHQATMERVLLRMVASEGGELARRRVPRAELVYPDAAENARVAEVLQRLEQARLVVSGNTEDGVAYIEPAHDALVRAWDKLLVWHRAAEAYLPLQRRLTQAADEWAAESNVKAKTDLLWKDDPRLPQVEETLAGNPEPVKRGWAATQWLRFRDLWRSAPLQVVEGHWLNALELDFVRRSVAQRRKEARRLAGTVTGVMMVLVALTVFALIQANLAEIARKDAEEKANIALARQSAVQAQSVLDNLPVQLPRALLLAVESLRRHPENQANQIVAGALDLLPYEVMRMTHEGEVSAVAFSPDGRWVVSGGDNTVRVWEAANGTEVARMTHEKRVNAVDFSPDGRWVVSGSSDQTARVWEAATGGEVARMTHDGGVETVIFSPDGRWVASGGGHTAQVWEAVTGIEIARMTHEVFVTTVLFSPDGQWMISAGCDEYNSGTCNRGSARVWEVANGIEFARMTHEGWVAVAFSPDGRWVVSGGDNTVRVWETATGAEIARMTHEGKVTSVHFSPDGQWVVSGSEDNTVRVWKSATGIEAARMTHEEVVSSVVFSPDGWWVVSSSLDNTARVWDATTGAEVARMTHEANVWVVDFSPDGRWMVSGSGDSTGDTTARVWDVSVNLNIGEVPGIIVSQVMHEEKVNAVAFSPDGRWIVSGGGFGDNTARVWEAATGSEIARNIHAGGVTVTAFSPDGRRIVSAGCDEYDFGCIRGSARVWEAVSGDEVACMTHDYGVNAVAFSPDGRWVVSSGRILNTLRVWEAATGNGIVWMAQAGDVNTVAFGPDGRWVISGDFDGTARVWEVATGAEVARMTHDHAVNVVAFSPDGRWVVSGSSDHTARVWETATGTEVTRMTHDGGVATVIFSPDGRWVVSGGDHTARVWEAATGAEVARLVHEGDVTSVAFSPDGQWVASSSLDNTVRVWEAVSGVEIARMTHEASVYAVAFSPDGQWVASGSYDGAVRVWWWKPEDMIRLACERLTRNLTREEWRQYLGDEPYRATCPNLPEAPPITSD